MFLVINTFDGKVMGVCEESELGFEWIVTPEGVVEVEIVEAK